MQQLRSTMNIVDLFLPTSPNLPTYQRVGLSDFILISKKHHEIYNLEFKTLLKNKIML